MVAPFDFEPEANLVSWGSSAAVLGAASAPKHCTSSSGCLVSGVSIPINRTLASSAGSIVTLDDPGHHHSPWL